MQFDGDFRQLIHVAKLPAAPFIVPNNSWRAPHGALSGTVRLGANLYDLEPLVSDLSQQLSTYKCRRIGIFRIPPCTALVLVPALRRVGISAVWFNDRWSARELKVAFETSRVSIVIVGGEEHAKLIIPDNVGILTVGKLPSPRVRCIRNPSLLPTFSRNANEEIQRDECVYFTSGSGGIPKGVRLAHASMDLQALEKVRRFPFNSSSVYLHLAPHFHVGGASSTLAALHTGARHIFLPFSGNLLGRAGEILDIIDHERVTILVLVPGLLSALVDTVDASRRSDFSGVQALIIGGSKTSSALAVKAARIFPNAANCIIGTYGSTECASSVAFAALNRGEFAGTPWHVDLAIVEGTEKRRGRLVTRGPHLMRGYLGSDSLSAGNSNWFETGDIGQLTPGGALCRVSRKGDVIRSGGETVDATEVERTIGEHTHVSYAAVVGVADKMLGEAVVAAVTLRDPAPTISAEALVGYCKQRLAGFKVPRWLFVFDKLPMSPMGKVLKPALRELVTQRVHALKEQRSLPESSAAPARL